MNRWRSRSYLVFTIILLLFGFKIIPAQARWKWSERKAFSIRMACQDGAMIVVGSEATAPSPNQMRINIYAENPQRSLGSVDLTLESHITPWYAEPDSAYTPFDPNGMWMPYHHSWRVFWHEDLSVGTPITVTNINFIGVEHKQTSVIWPCRVQDSLFANGVITWRNQTTQDVRRYLINASNDSYQVIAVGSLGALEDQNTSIVGVGDYNGDTQPDLILQHPDSPTARVAFHLINGLTSIGFSRGVLINPAIKLVGNGDYNGDGQDDSLAYDTNTGDVWVNYLVEQGVLTDAPIRLGRIDDLNWQIIGSGDFDANGADDILWRNRTNGALRAWLNNPMQNTHSEVSLNVQEPLTLRVNGVADFDGDNYADLSWIDPQTGDAYMSLSNGTPLTGSTVALKALNTLPSIPKLTAATKNGPMLAFSPHQAEDQSWKVVNTQDFNGDGKADLLWYNSSIPKLQLNLLNGVTLLAQHDLPIPEGQGWSIVNTTDTNDLVELSTPTPTATPTAATVFNPTVTSTPIATNTPLATVTPTPLATEISSADEQLYLPLITR